jgi:hypothetical protein
MKKLKEFFRPTRIKLLVTVFCIVLAVLVGNGIIGEYVLGHWLWEVIGLIFSPLIYFHNFGIWVLSVVDPSIVEATESIRLQLRFNHLAFINSLFLSFRFNYSKVF